MKPKFPKMIFIDGDPGNAWRIVPDEDAEKAAAADGFYRVGGKPAEKPKAAKRGRKASK